MNGATKIDAVSRHGGGKPTPFEVVVLHARPIVDGWKLLGLALFLATWTLAHLAVGAYLPGPLPVVRTALTNLFSSHYMQGLGLPEGGYWPHIWATTVMTLLGVSIGGTVGIMTGLSSSRYRAIGDIFAPLFAIFGTIPILIATPFFIIWFGLAATAKVALVAFYSATLVHIYTMRAIAHVHPAYREYARTLGATDTRAFISVLFPGCIPELFGGLRLALMNAWGLATVVELMGSNVGIGRLLSAAWAVYDTTAMMAAVLWISLIAVIFDSLLVACRNYVVRWSETLSRSEF